MVPIITAFFKKNYIPPKTTAYLAYHDGENSVIDINVFGLASMSDLFYDICDDTSREIPFNIDPKGILESTADVHCFLEMCQAREHHIPLVTDTPKFFSTSDMSNMKWSLGNVFRASKLCDVLRIKAQSILRNEKSTFYTSLCVRGDGGFSSAVSTLIINWIVFHQIALKTQNAQLEADLQHLLTTEHKLPNKLQYEIAGIYHHFSRLTNSTCLGSVRDFLIANIGWSVGSNRIVPPVCYAFEL